jgi:hypothetical protein
LPALEYGIRFDMTYKNFDVSLFGSGIAGRTGFDVYTTYNNLMRSRENVGPAYSMLGLHKTLTQLCQRLP